MVVDSQYPLMYIFMWTLTVHFMKIFLHLQEKIIQIQYKSKDNEYGNKRGVKSFGIKRE
jgi:hypothetical protein